MFIVLLCILCIHYDNKLDFELNWKLNSHVLIVYWRLSSFVHVLCLLFCDDRASCKTACGWWVILYKYVLTHWGRVTHICVGNLTIIGSDNGLSPGRRQAITWTNVGILLIGPLGTNLKMSSGKWRPFCLGLSVLIKKTQKNITYFRDLLTLWRPEYAAYMIEGTPGKPYGHRMAHFNMVEDNMRHR